MVDLVNLEERIGHMEKKMEENMARIVKLIQNPKENISEGDDVAHGTREDKDSVQVYQPSTNKHSPRGFDSNNGSNQGWSSRGIQLPNIYMRKFDAKDPITWIFYMEQFFDIQ